MSSSSSESKPKIENDRDKVRAEIAEMKREENSDERKLKKLMAKDQKLTAQLAASKRLHAEYDRVSKERGGRQYYTHATIADKFNCTRPNITNRLNGQLAINSTWLKRFCDEFQCDPARIYPELVKEDPSITVAMDIELLRNIEGLSFDDKLIYKELVKTLSDCSDDFRNSLLLLVRSQNKESSSDCDSSE